MGGESRTVSAIRGLQDSRDLIVAEYGVCRVRLAGTGRPDVTVIDWRRAG